jgi:hypothetical protein
MVPTTMYKAIQLDLVTRQRTGAEHLLDVETRQAALDQLLALLATTPAAARVDPSRTMVQVGSELWTLVGLSAPRSPDAPTAGQRRGGAKHKHVR